MSNKVYGIDLGTTNSLIGYGDKIYGGMIPSIVHAVEKKAGAQYKHIHEDYIFRSFKKDISLGKVGAVSVKASSLVLKELVNQVTDDKVERVVISVPAKFSDDSRQATMQAAEMIGLKVEAIIDEPTAAALKYTRSSMKVCIVYDLGGGTFDVSVIDSRFGIYDVQDSRGLLIGGDDLDTAIVKYLVNNRILYIHKMNKNDMSKLKEMCEEAKIYIQNKKVDYVFNLEKFVHCASVLDYTLTVDNYKSVMKSVFKQTLVLTKRIIAESVDTGVNYDFIFVGGSTRCPFLREWIEMEIQHKAVDITYNQDTLVAEGVAYYSQLLEKGLAQTMISSIIPQPVSIELSDGTSQILIARNTKIPCSETKLFTSNEACTGLNIKVYQGESIIASNNTFIGSMKYNFGKQVEAFEANVIVTLSVDENGIISITGKEPGKSPQVIKLDREAIVGDK